MQSSWCPSALLGACIFFRWTIATSGTIKMIFKKSLKPVKAAFFKHTYKFRIEYYLFISIDGNR